ncbi:MAG: hypothetical protein ACOCZ6_04710 [Nanoarchaeota archaeon]
MGEPDLFDKLKAEKLVSVTNYRLRLLDDIDISMYGSKAWAYTLQKIAEEKGRKFLFEKGYSMGKVAAEQIKEKKDKVPENLQTTDNFVMMAGFGCVNIFDLNNNIEVKVQKNHIIRFARELYGKESLVCNFYKGIYNAFVDVFIAKSRLEEISCICQGNLSCSFKGEKSV